MTRGNYSACAVSAAGGDAEPLIRMRRRERRDAASRSQLVERVTAEFREMPCLRLTPGQADRLFGLRTDISRRVLDELVRQGVVRIDEEGRYAAPC